MEYEKVRRTTWFVGFSISRRGVILRRSDIWRLAPPFQERYSVLHKRINHTWDFVVMQAREQLRYTHIDMLKDTHTRTHAWPEPHSVFVVQGIQTEAEGGPYCFGVSGAGLLARQQNAGRFSLRLTAICQLVMLLNPMLCFSMLYIFTSTFFFFAI